MNYKITESTKFNEPSSERPHAVCKEGSGTGTQKIWRFKNGFGASVVQFNIIGISGSFGGSYGIEEGLWELAVIKFNDEGFSLTYDTKVTDNVIGHLTPKDVEKKLEEIKKLKEAQKK